jgi:hypothetical protein
MSFTNKKTVEENFRQEINDYKERNNKAEEYEKKQQDKINLISYIENLNK